MGYGIGTADILMGIHLSGVHLQFLIEIIRIAPGLHRAGVGILRQLGRSRSGKAVGYMLEICHCHWNAAFRQGMGFVVIESAGATIDRLPASYGYRHL